MEKTVIIGGGVAGLAAGIYGQLSGLDCVIMEKNRFAGGNLTGWERQGCFIDNCMHWLTGTRRDTALNDVWRTVGMLGDNVCIFQADSFYTSEYGSRRISLRRDANRTLAEMCAVSPEDTAESKRFIEAVKLIGNAESNGFSGKLACLPALARYGAISLDGLAARFRHPLLKKLMTDYLGGELSALALVFSYGAFASGNGDVPEGGSREAAMRMESRFLSLGGTLLFDCEAAKAVISGKRVVGVLTKDGRLVRCSSLICCCDPHIVFGSVLPEKYMPARMRRAFNDDRHTPLFSSLHAAFSCDVTDELPENTVIFGISPLGTEGRTQTRMTVKPYRAAQVDVPEGKAVLQVMYFLYDREARRWIRCSSDRAVYRDAKNSFGNAVGKRITARFPSLGPSLRLLDVWTPATYARYFNSYHGAFLSFGMKPGRALIYRVPPKVRGLENVFLASQWQSVPGGLPVAALNAKRAVELLVRERVPERRTVQRTPVRAGI